MKLLLTGATGFVGRNLLLRVLKENRYETIYLLIRDEKKLREQLKTDGISELPKSVQLLVASAPEWKLGQVESVDHVIHSAGLLSAHRREIYFRTNAQGTLNLLRALPKFDRLVVLSSQAASGPCLPGTVERSEGDAETPVTWYGESKLEMERKLREEFPQTPYLCLRPPMVLGPRDSASLQLFQMVRSPLHFKPGFRPKFYSYIGVHDLVDAILTCLGSEKEWPKGETYFVVSGSRFSDRDLIQGAAQACGRKGALIPVPQPVLWLISRMVDLSPKLRSALPNLSRDRAREIWPDHWVVSAKKFREKFGWNPKENLLGTLKETFAWYVKSGQIKS